MSEQVTNGTAISMAQAQEIAAQYRNVTIEDVQLGGHFRIVIRNIALPCNPMIWRYWNFDTEALAALELHLQTDGVKACTDDDPGRTFSG